MITVVQEARIVVRGTHSELLQRRGPMRNYIDSNPAG
jgi:ABC-type multidrug transport system fused ATPase/permease subunit